MKPSKPLPNKPSSTPNRGNTNNRGGNIPTQPVKIPMPKPPQK